MIKGVLKEIIIILLLTLAIILLLGVLLYDYVPMNKTIPEQISYSATEEVRTALEERQATDQEDVILSYEVTSTDLKNYQRVNEYQAGRKNPFESVNKPQENIATNNTTNNTGTTSSSGTTKTPKNENQGTTLSNTEKDTNSSKSTNTNYYPDKGIK